LAGMLAYVGLFHFGLLIIFLIVSFGVTYLVFHLRFKNYVDKKVSVIYEELENIDAVVDTKSKKTVNTDMDSLINKVKDYAANRKSEIDNLKGREEYRKEFLGNVSHELKTPIFNIQGYLLTLLDGGMEDPNINYKYLTRAAENTERMEKIVADLGYISKFEAGKLQLHLTNFDICQLVKDVLEDSELKASEKNITLSFKNNNQKPLKVDADMESIRRVLVNLISNSIKYGKENGDTLVGFYDLDNNILVEISDNGKGIAQEHIPRLFERFYRVDKGRSRTEGGSGLGLAIVKHILEALQQTITARSRVDLGSTFGFTLKKAE